MIIISIILCLIAIAIFLISLKVINKFIFKDKIKLNIFELIIGWVVIFCINIIFVITDIPMALGIPISPNFDAGANKYYFSLGYVIHTTKPVIEEDENTETIAEFVSPFTWK